MMATVEDLLGPKPVTVEGLLGPRSQAPTGGSKTQAALLIGTVPTGGSTDMQLEALRKMYPDAQRDGDNFTYTDESGKSTKLSGGTFFGMLGDIGRLSANVITGGNLPSSAVQGQTDWQQGFPQLAANARLLAEFGGGTLGAIGGGALGGPLGAVAGAGLGAAGARELVERIGMATQGITDSRSNLDVASEAATTAGLNAAGQGAGELLGYGLRSGIKRLATRGNQLETRNAIADSARWDHVPDMASATKNRMLDSTQNLSGKFPGGAGVIANAADDTQQRIAAEMARKLEAYAGQAPDHLSAGVAIGKGIEDFTKDFTDKAQALYQKANDLLSPDTYSSVKNYRTILETLAENSDMAATKPLVNKTAQALRDGLETSIRDEATRHLEEARLGHLPRNSPPDPESGGMGVFDSDGGLTAGGGGVTSLPQGSLKFGDVQRIRSQIGRSLGAPSLGPDSMPRAELKRIYAALTDDMRIALQGPEAKPGALKAFDDANDFYKKGLDKIDTFLEPLYKNRDVPEEVFAAVERVGKRGPTRLRELKSAVTPEQWRLVAATVADSLGRPLTESDPASFSFDNFLKRYTVLQRSGAADVLFDKSMRQDLDALRRVTNRIKQSSKAFSNPPNTSSTWVGQTMILAALGSAMYGQLRGAATVAGAAAGSYGIAKLMTSPKAVKWLAEGTRTAPNSWGAWLGRAAGIAMNSDPDTRDAIRNFVRRLGEASREQRAYEFNEDGTPVEVLLDAGVGESHAAVTNRYRKTGQNLGKGPPGTFSSKVENAGPAAPEMPQDSNYGAMASFPLGKMQLEDQIDPRLRGVPQ